jgi:hypothetical protein
MNVKASWQNISLVGMKDMPPQEYAISSPDMNIKTTSIGNIFMPPQEYAVYSPDMHIETTRLGNFFMPTSVEDDILEKGLPISIFLGDNLDEILALFSTYPGFRKKI